jgi:hypothetical protein
MQPELQKLFDIREQQKADLLIKIGSLMLLNSTSTHPVNGRSVKYLHISLLPNNYRFSTSRKRLRLLMNNPTRAL